MMTPEHAQPARQSRFRRLMRRLGLRRRPEPVQAYAPPPAPHPYPQPQYPHPYPYPQVQPPPGAQPPEPRPLAGPAAPEPPMAPPALPSAAYPPPELWEPVPPAQPPAPPATQERAAEEPAEPPAAPADTEQTRASSDLTSPALASLAMRDLTLVDSMLDIVEDLEENTEDSELLAKLFKLDNLATRMRRNGENLLVLAGEEPDESQVEPLALLDVARAAISEIKDYDRVHVGRLPSRAVAGPVADDLGHLLAELLDNSTAKSPEHAQVVISGQPMADGNILLVVEDEGIGIPADQLAVLNSRLEGEPTLDEDSMRHMGLYVVRRIAHRHGLRVQLEARSFRGTSAFVVVPAELLRETPRESRGVHQPSARVDKPTAAAEEAAPGTRPPGSPEPANGASPVTAAGLPRRSARAGSPMASPPPEPSAKPAASDPSAESGTPASPVTEAGLPRRTAHTNSIPPVEPPENGTRPPTGGGDEGDGETSSPTTEAGLPRRSARAGSLPAVPDAAGSGPAVVGGVGAATDRAEQIRDELGSFLEGERAALSGEAEERP